MSRRVMNGKMPVWFAMVVALVFGANFAHAQSGTAQTTKQIIVKFREAGIPQTQAATASRLSRFTTDAAAAGVPLRPLRAMALGAHVMTLDRPHSRSEVEAIAARLAQHPDVEFVQPDFRRHPYRTTNDSLVWAQPYLGSVVGGINAFGAWDVTTGSTSVVVAVVDTGYRPHADLAGRILPGYDFITDPKIANDGDSRDADASDPGDWVSAADKTDPEFRECDIGDSSWHGTGVAGSIAANSNNGQWLAGIDWGARILSVRALGKCGGDDSVYLE